jgi:AcrR family transcriptional regulator
MPDRRQTIIDAALEVIRAHPVADVQLAAIAAQAGMKPNHVLYYFPSRDDVLIEAVRYAELQLAERRAESLRTPATPAERLTRFVTEYLPDDRHDPVWKLWLEGWLRSASHERFGSVGRALQERWIADLADVVGALEDDAHAFARRFLLGLDGMAMHVIAGHLTTAEARSLAMTTLSVELRMQPERD